MQNTCKFFGNAGNNRSDYDGIEGDFKVRSSEKGLTIQSMDGRLFGVDFHDFIQKEQHATSFELASEFGLTIGDVRKLKKHLERS
jgi:hypothetical protein